MTDRHGLHARPPPGWWRCPLLRPRPPLTNVRTGKGPVDARSLRRVATLDARHGDRVRVAASGPQAEEALARGRVAGRKTGSPATVSRSGDPCRSASYQLRTRCGNRTGAGPPRAADLAAYAPGDGHGGAVRRSRTAAGVVRARLADLEQRSPDEAAAILAAQRALLTDPGVADAVGADLAGGVPATQAWRRRLDAVAARFAQLADPYQRERAADVRSVQIAVLRVLTDMPEGGVESDVPVVLVVDELEVTTAASVGPERVAGIVVTARGRTGHGAIVAASRGIPLFTEAGDRAAEIRTGQWVAFDARRGGCEVGQRRGRSRGLAGVRRRARAPSAGRASRPRGDPAVTRDGMPGAGAANVGSLLDAETAAALRGGRCGPGPDRGAVRAPREPPSVAEQTRDVAGARGGAGRRR